jgi:hypothetical protein
MWFSPNWELEQGGGLDGARHLHPYTHKYLDLFFTYKKDRVQGIRFRLFATRSDFEEIWKVKALYRLTIRVEARNTMAKEIKLLLNWTGNWEQFAVGLEQDQSLPSSLVNGP